MKQLLILTIFSIFNFPSFAQFPSTEQQINNAVLPLDEENRANSTVYGYTENGDLITLRKGTNGMICLADNPKLDGINIACYHEDAEPFMARGRELKKEGKNAQEIFDIRENEAKAGTLKMPANGSTLYVMSGKTLEDANTRWVVYIPWATSESTGLPLKPLVPGGPWIMNPGTHRAHIMITPPSE